ncbi:MAG: nucleotidyl transferase AbiEii/AbiGii toxin family protein [Bacteroidales bacterium]|nr:nucleotidyl transferase AbiEii/AbiGii toxin family protein [Bacteroidales bacterium]
MILPESRNLEWIEKAAADNHTTNPILVEKVIRAFSLLESLARSGCPFIFKGGSSLMLHFGSSRRLSIDIDLICPPGTEIEKYWEQYSRDYGFTIMEAVDRIYIKE